MKRIKGVSCYTQNEAKARGLGQRVGEVYYTYDPVTGKRYRHTVTSRTRTGTGTGDTGGTAKLLPSHNAPRKRYHTAHTHKTTRKPKGYDAKSYVLARYGHFADENAGYFPLAAEAVYHCDNAIRKVDGINEALAPLDRALTNGLKLLAATTAPFWIAWILFCVCGAFEWLHPGWMCDFYIDNIPALAQEAYVRATHTGQTTIIKDDGTVEVFLNAGDFEG